MGGILRRFNRRKPELDGNRARRFSRTSVAVCALLALGWLAACGGGSTSNPVLVVLTPNNPQAIDQGQSVPMTAFLANNTSTAGVKWTMSSSQCTGSACGSFTSVTPTSATYVAPSSVTKVIVVTITATFASNSGIAATNTVTVNPPPQILTTSLPAGINGENYDQQIVVSGGVTPLIYSISSGSLPAGLQLNTNGFVQGRPSGNGTNSTFTVQVHDQGTPPITQSQSFSISIQGPPAISFTTTSLPNAAQGSPYNFALAAAGGVPPLTWSVASGSLPPGLSLDPTSGQISGIPTTQGAFSFTPAATDSAIPPQNASPAAPLTLTVGPPNPLSVATTTLPDGVTATAYSATLRVNGGVGPFTWAITGGVLPSGLSLDPANGVISGLPTAITSASFSVQVTDSELTPMTASASLTLAVVSATNNGRLLDGNYAFVFNGTNSVGLASQNGFASSGPLALGGVFTADGGGNITFGVMDVNQASGPQQQLPFTGKYTIGSDGRGTFNITITVSSTSTTVTIVTFTYQLVFDGNGDAQYIETDTSGVHGTGILRKQTLSNFTDANFSGNYAFELGGTDSSKLRTVMAGVVHADGISLFSNGVADLNDGGTASSDLTGIGGSFFVGSNGRGSATLSNLTSAPLNFTIYMVSPDDVLFVGADALGSANPLTTGEMLLQTQPSFSVGSLSGTSVATMTGLDSSGNSSVLAGLLSADGANNVSATVDSNDGGSVLSNSSASGTYSVASNGRFTLSGLGGQLAVGYLTSQNQGFLIGQDSAASTGLLEAQTGGGSFTLFSVQSYYTFGPLWNGAAGLPSSKVSALLGSFNADGAGNLAGKVDKVATTGNPGSNLVLKGTYTIDPTGRGSITLTSPASLPTQFVFYIVSPTEIRAISSLTTDTEPQVLFFNH